MDLFQFLLTNLGVNLHLPFALLLPLFDRNPRAKQLLNVSYLAQIIHTPQSACVKAFWRWLYLNLLILRTWKNKIRAFSLRHTKLLAQAELGNEGWIGAFPFSFTVQLLQPQIYFRFPAKPLYPSHGFLFLNSRAFGHVLQIHDITKQFSWLEINYSK